jgi:hypothetical protein
MGTNALFIILLSHPITHTHHTLTQQTLLFEEHAFINQTT